LAAFASVGFSMDAVRDGDMALVSSPVDFLGVNYYSTWAVASVSRLAEARQAGFVAPDSLASSETASLGLAAVGRPWLDKTSTGWEIDPGGLTATLARVRDEYTQVPLYVTENGVAFDDYRGPDGAVHDAARVAYLAAHVKAVEDAINTGTDVRGYFVWSLLDNFEWAEGFSKRFGLTWVDYPGSERVKKDSFYWFQKLVAANGLPGAG